MSPGCDLQILVLTAVLAGVSAPALALAPLPSADAVAALCEYSECAEQRFASAFGGAAEATQGRVTLVTLPATVETAPPFERLLAAAEEARDYARERAARLLDTYTVVVPTSALASLVYTPEIGALTGQTGELVELFDGAAALEIVGDTLVDFSLSPVDAAELVELHSMGALEARITFRIATRTDPWAGYCAADERPVIPAELLRVELLDARPLPLRGHAPHAVVSDLTDGFEVNESRLAPEVDVMVAEASGATPQEIGLVSTLLEAALPNCYAVGLATNRSMTGALTLGFELTPDGRTVAPAVAIDVLDSQPVRECAVAAVDRLVVDRGRSAAPAAVRLTLRFEPGDSSL